MVRTVVISSVFTTWPHGRSLRGRDVLEFCFGVGRALPNWPRLLRFNRVPLSAGRLERRTTGGERRRVCTDAFVRAAHSGPGEVDANAPSALVLYAVRPDLITCESSFFRIDCSRPIRFRKR